MSGKEVEQLRCEWRVERGLGVVTIFLEYAGSSTHDSVSDYCPGH
jgi:vancomycin permeability regulator SanA